MRTYKLAEHIQAIDPDGWVLLNERAKLLIASDDAPPADGLDQDSPEAEAYRANPEWIAANQPNCHRCGRPCVQGKFGSWMCDCSSTPFDERDICPKCKEPINDDMGHMCP